MSCPQCGATDDGGTRCPSCGAPTGRRASSRPHPAPVQAPPPPVPLEAPARTPGRGGLLRSLRAGAQQKVRRRPTVATVTTAKLPRLDAEAHAGSDAVPLAPSTSDGEAPAEAPGFRPRPAPPELLAPPEPDEGQSGVDPWLLGPAVARLSAGARRDAAVPLALAASLLAEGERVDAVVQGRYQHHDAVVVLTDERVLVVNARAWRPDVRSVALDGELGAQTWQDDCRATVLLAVGGAGIVVSDIVDRPLAGDLVRRIEARAGATSP